MSESKPVKLFNEHGEFVGTAVGGKITELVTARDTALFNEILNLLGPEPPSCCGCAVEWQAAIDLLRKRLDLCPKCGSWDIGNRSQRNSADELEVGWQECSDCGHQWGHG